jgi:hypothetical protein
MDNPSDDIFVARSEGFVTRTRMNSPDKSSQERYDQSMDSGTTINSFDQGMEISFFKSEIIFLK